MSYKEVLEQIPDEKQRKKLVNYICSLKRGIFMRCISSPWKCSTSMLCSIQLFIIIRLNMSRRNLYHSAPTITPWRLGQIVHRDEGEHYEIGRVSKVTLTFVSRFIHLCKSSQWLSAIDMVNHMLGAPSCSIIHWSSYFLLYRYCGDPFMFALKTCILDNNVCRSCPPRFMIVLISSMSNSRWKAA